MPEILGNRGDQIHHPPMHSTDVSMVRWPLIAAANYRIVDTALPTVVDGQSLVVNVVVSNQRHACTCSRTLGRKGYEEFGIFAGYGVHN